LGASILSDLCISNSLSILLVYRILLAFARLFRPPYYILKENVRETANRLGYQTVMGESVGDAAPNVTLDEIISNSESTLRVWDKPYRCVLVFNDHSPTTDEHSAEIVETLQQQGFVLVDFEAEWL
jgi:hypothetical protein